MYGDHQARFPSAVFTVNTPPPLWPCLTTVRSASDAREDNPRENLGGRGIDQLSLQMTTKQKTDAKTPASTPDRVFYLPPPPQRKAHRVLAKQKMIKKTTADKGRDSATTEASVVANKGNTEEQDDMETGTAQAADGKQDESCWRTRRAELSKQTICLIRMPGVQQAASAWVPYYGERTLSTSRAWKERESHCRDSPGETYGAGCPYRRGLCGEIYVVACLERHRPSRAERRGEGRDNTAQRGREKNLHSD